MAQFALQFLNGIGSAYTEPVRSYSNVYETKNPLLDYNNEKKDTNMDNEYQYQQCCCTQHEDQDKTSSMVKYLVVFALGCVGGQVIKNIFTDKKKD